MPPILLICFAWDYCQRVISSPRELAQYAICAQRMQLVRSDDADIVDRDIMTREPAHA